MLIEGIETSTGSESSFMLMNLDVGKEMYELVKELYPICRSITGHGVRETLGILGRYIPLQTHEVATGTKVLDWTIPKEWNISEAHIQSASGRRVVDFKKCNLHVMGYSVPVNRRVSLAELKKHIFSDPEHPDWVPYRTSYYKENWGFCLSHNEATRLTDAEYDVYIASSLKDGHLSYGEDYLPGTTDEEVLFYTHVCHPSLCNDNLSGIAVAVYLAQALRQRPRRLSYRFLFCPGTIGSITWLAKNQPQTHKVRHGLVFACLGDAGNPTYKRSRRGNAIIDRAVEHVLKHSGQGYTIKEFSPYGYDERQFCSPGFNLPVGCLMRTPHGCYPEYHTSADNLELVQPSCLANSLSLCLAVTDVLEHDQIYVNQSPKGEPQLGKRGLYGSMGGSTGGREKEMALLWVLNLSDGEHSLLDIAERSEISFERIHAAAESLVQVGLLKKSEPEQVGTRAGGQLS